MHKLREMSSTSIAIRQCLFHTHERITPFGLQSLFISTIKRLQKYYNSMPFNLTLTSLEEGVVLGYIQKLGDPAQGGTNQSQGDRSNQLMESQSMQI